MQSQRAGHAPPRPSRRSRGGPLPALPSVGRALRARMAAIVGGVPGRRPTVRISRLRRRSHRRAPWRVSSASSCSRNALSFSRREMRASAFRCIAAASSGAIRTKKRCVGCWSTASKSTPFVLRAKPATTLLVPDSRPCGIAMPSPIAVLLRRSRSRRTADQARPTSPAGSARPAGSRAPRGPRPWWSPVSSGMTRSRAQDVRDRHARGRGRWPRAARDGRARGAALR